MTKSENASAGLAASAKCAVAVVTAPHGAVYCMPMVLPMAISGRLTVPFTAFSATAKPSTVMTASSFTQPETVTAAMGSAPSNSEGAASEKSASSTSPLETDCPAAVTPVTVQVYRPGNRLRYRMPSAICSPGRGMPSSESSRLRAGECSRSCTLRTETV